MTYKEMLLAAIVDGRELVNENEVRKRFRNDEWEVCCSDDVWGPTASPPCAHNGWAVAPEQRWANMYENLVVAWYDSRERADQSASPDRIGVLRVDMVDGKSTNPVIEKV